MTCDYRLHCTRWAGEGVRSTFVAKMVLRPLVCYSGASHLPARETHLGSSGLWR
jgi:hypothetical protein